VIRGRYARAQSHVRRLDFRRAADELARVIGDAEAMGASPLCDRPDEDDRFLGRARSQWAAFEKLALLDDAALAKELRSTRLGLRDLAADVDHGSRSAITSALAQLAELGSERGACPGTEDR
jgi:hypothetical protein